MESKDGCIGLLTTEQRTIKNCRRALILTPQMGVAAGARVAVSEPLAEPSRS
jgi:hypothetical protein